MESGVHCVLQKTARCLKTLTYSNNTFLSCLLLRFDLLSLSVCLSLQTSACPEFASLCFTSHVCVCVFAVLFHCVCVFLQQQPLVVPEGILDVTPTT